MINTYKNDDLDGEDTIVTALGDTAAVIDAIDRLHETEKIDVDLRTDEKVPLIVVPKGKEVVNLKPLFDQFRAYPERKRGTAALSTIESFIAHVNRFKDDESAIFLDDLGPTLIGVLDYHKKGAGHARFGIHRGEYAFPLSAEWRTWTGRDGKEMSQAEFAVFLEDRIPDVLAPGSVGDKTRDFAASAGIQFATPTRLLELSRGLSIKVDTQVAQHVNPSTGEAQLVFKEEHTSDGASALKVPSGFAVLIPVVKNGPAYQIPVRLRYRVAGGRVLWKFSLYRTDLIFEEMLLEAVAKVEKETALPLYRGRPEA